MKKNKVIIPFYVLNWETNSHKVEHYDIMPYLIECFEKIKKKTERPSTFEEFKKFITDNSMYMYWSRCQYEILISDFPNKKYQEKIDIHDQIMMNLGVIARILVINVL